MPDREIVRILNRINAEAESDGDIAKSKDVLEVLSAIRRQGYSFSASKPWGAAIAAPLPSMPGEPSLAVGIGGITKIMAGNKERYAELLLNSIRKYFGNLAGSLG
jgi:DNA-binding IclR family transcriptional regulator